MFFSLIFVLYVVNVVLAAYEFLSLLKGEQRVGYARGSLIVAHGLSQCEEAVQHFLVGVYVCGVCGLEQAVVSAFQFASLYV